jgi:hypothetical protein
MYLAFQLPIRLLETSDAAVASWGFTLPHMFCYGLSNAITTELNSTHSPFAYKFL